jgi:hypothetical protein
VSGAEDMGLAGVFGECPWAHPGGQCPWAHPGGQGSARRGGGMLLLRRVVGRARGKRQAK